MASVGVGVVFNPVVPAFLEAFPESVDYVELIPETLWTDHGNGAEDRFVDIPAAWAQFRPLAQRYPVVCHGVGLSIGSDMPLDYGLLARMKQVVGEFQVTRFSEHLGFSRVAFGESLDRHMGVGLPLPCDEDVLVWLTERVRAATNALGISLIFENGVRHTPFIEEDMPEPVFINRLAAATGCGMLLDLHNLYVDCRNNGWSPENYLGKLDLKVVREIHVAGGSVIGDAYTDSHAGPSPPEVWSLLEDFAPRAENLEGITFEFHESYFPNFGPEILRQELLRLKEFSNGLQ